MITRRGIRVKALQSLYSELSAESKLSEKVAVKHFVESCNRAESLGVTYLYLAKEILEFSSVEKVQKSNKYLPSRDDLAISDKPCNNRIVQKISKNESFHKAVEKNHLQSQFEQDQIKDLYLLWKKTDNYTEYVKDSTHVYAQDENCFLEVLDLIMHNEDLQSTIEDKIPTIQDDIDSVASWLSKQIDAVETINFESSIESDKLKFGKELIKTFIDKFVLSAELIKPKLTNWDPDRIATLDMMILQMGICELLYFPTIPTKVTINEYIDIAKWYSTLQSGNFVNGVLDKIHKELVAENKINKIAYKNG
jgi:N utilization substance protein B